MPSRRFLVGGVGGALLLAILVVSILYLSGTEQGTSSGSAETDREAESSASYVGGKACAVCHASQYQTWTGSHHDLAMQVASDETVLGDFNDSEITHFGVTSKFYKRDGKFYVKTEGPEGALQEYEITHTFGADPLQQYLIAFPGGRYQSLGLAWDARPRMQGGQRWFHLYPDEKVPHDDALHWTGPNQNWNYMCAACHSTNLEKNYKLENDVYATTWSDIDVSCEACHGPGSEHVEWAESYAKDGESGRGGAKGLVVTFERTDSITWKPDPTTGIAKREPTEFSNQQVETCAQCHSRRRVIHGEGVPGHSFLDSYQPSLLEGRLYHPDGQIMEEVYVYGSFLQSKMYASGVTCTNCHEPHGLKLRVSGNGLCTQCHAAESFDTPRHHFHKPPSKGALCVECHMPSKTYMVVDPRRDHSFRVPRPDLSVKIGTPNACNACHQDKSPQWAARAIKKWHGDSGADRARYAEGILKGRRRQPQADVELADIVANGRNPGIVQATALALLRGYAGQHTLDAIQKGVEDEDPLVRVGAVRALGALRPENRVDLAATLLDDPIRAVRIETARMLAAVPRQRLSTPQQKAFDEAAEEYVAAELVNAERPSSHMNLGVFYSERGQFQEAERSYQTALRLDADFYPALVNLADLYRLQKRDEEGEKLLRQALAAAPEDANVHHSLGLLLIRTDRREEAVESFAEASRLRPDDPRHSYVYGIALNSIGKSGEAVEVLEAAHDQHPNHLEILLALISIHRDNGQRDIAIGYAEKLAALAPDDQGPKQLLKQLRGGK